MNAELRALGWAQGVLLGFVIASPLIGGWWLANGIEALFIVGAFQLRLTDRRWKIRPGFGGWISHIRMAPVRILPWGAIVLATAMSGDVVSTCAIALAAISCELLVYPVVAPLVGKLTRRSSIVALAVLLCGCAVIGNAVAQLILAYCLGLMTCMVWLRGPDGEAHALAIPTLGVVAAGTSMTVWPASMIVAWPVGVLCATLTLAHLSVLRRQPFPWRSWGSVGRFRPRLADLL